MFFAWTSTLPYAHVHACVRMGGGGGNIHVSTHLSDTEPARVSEFYAMRCIHDIQQMQFISQSVSQDGLANIPVRTRDRKFDCSEKRRGRQSPNKQFAQL
jgi:hypothetical protein